MSSKFNEIIDGKLYSGHTASEVIELMEALARQHDVHSADEALAIARRGAALLKDQQSKLRRISGLVDVMEECADDIGALNHGVCKIRESLSDE